MTTHIGWQGVPEEKLEQWRVRFRTPSGHVVRGECPVCSASTLYRYFQLAKSCPTSIKGLDFLGSGAGWEWCGTCLTFEHTSGLVPAWWISDLEVDDALLTAIPQALDDAVRARQRVDRA